jgi:signal transduction histidine kinase
VARSKAPAIDKDKAGPSVAIFANSDLLARESSLSNPVNVALPNVLPSLDPGALGGRESQSQTAQSLRNAAEFVQRASASQQGQLQAIEGNSRFNDLLASGPAPGVPSVASVSAENVFKPIWLDDALVLGRRVSQGKTSLIQGVWLNWAHLRSSLLATIRDLFPEANLEPAPPGTGHEARLLASLPVRLVPGPVSRPPRETWTPIRLTLAFAGIFVMVAAVAIGVLLHGTLSLSERRAAFVSAVTHELRTPLMTFQMYSEMLAEGMIADEGQRRHYLTTLCSEANRLSHLVENVLAYARLERRSARSRIEQVSLRDLMTRVQPRLKDRAALAGLTLTEKVAPDAARAVMHVDITAVEQILFNLVDNACKYGAPQAPENGIGLEAELENSRRVRLRIRDHGPGLHPDAARHLFEPFSKSAQEAAHTAPGVGLGLALCRRLSRSMGGDLRLIPGDKHGACFELTLPVCAPGPTTLG